jgi:hypothetical protein
MIVVGINNNFSKSIMHNVLEHVDYSGDNDMTPCTSPWQSHTLISGRASRALTPSTRSWFTLKGRS